MEEKINEKGDSLAVYELSFLLLPSLAQEQVPAKADALKNVVTSAGGNVISGEEPVLIDLAYEMVKVISTVRHKVTTGYFGWIKFEISTTGIEAVKKSLDANDDIIRYLIIRTVRENTLLNGKMKLQKEERIRRDEEVEGEEVVAEKEVVPEDVDKSIDELVIA
jgi:ribosomal protein S6